MTERVHLAPEAIEAVAHRVVELLRDEPTSPDQRLVDATELAEILSVSRATVYEHATELGAVRIGDGKRPRLRFNVATALIAWQRCAPRHEPAPERTTPRRRTTSRTAELLPIRGQEVA